jgi:hypothetical protein
MAGTDRPVEVEPDAWIDALLAEDDFERIDYADPTRVREKPRARHKRGALSRAGTDPAACPQAEGDVRQAPASSHGRKWTPIG